MLNTSTDATLYTSVAPLNYGHNGPPSSNGFGPDLAVQLLSSMDDILLNTELQPWENVCHISAVND